jgi:hypothetical protein
MSQAKIKVLFSLQDNTLDVVDGFITFHDKPLDPQPGLYYSETTIQSKDLNQLILKKPVELLYALTPSYIYLIQINGREIGTDFDVEDIIDVYQVDLPLI